MREKRNRQRRNYSAKRSFPLTDSNGCIVPFDRSRIPDRRLNNLQVAEIEVDIYHLQRLSGRAS